LESSDRRRQRFRDLRTFGAAASPWTASVGIFASTNFEFPHLSVPHGFASLRESRRKVHRCKREEEREGNPVECQMLRCRQQLDKHGQPWLAEGHCGDSRLRENLLKEKSKRESASQQSRERTRPWERERRRGRGFRTKGSHDGGGKFG